MTIKLNLDAIIGPLIDAGTQGISARQYSALCRKAGINAKHLQPIPKILVEQGVFYQKVDLKTYRYRIRRPSF